MTAVSVLGTGWPRAYACAAIFLVVAVINLVVFSGVLQKGSLLEEANSTSESTSWYGQSARSSASRGQGPFYPVCVLSSIGDPTYNPNDKALPFPQLYRLFDAAKEEIYKLLREESDSKISKQPLGTYDGDDIAMDDVENVDFPLNLLVAADFTPLVCKMARDSLHDYGPGLRGVVGVTCKSFEQLQPNSSESSSSSISCGTAVVGKTTRYVPQITLELAQLISWDNLKVVDLDVRDASRDKPDLRPEAWRPTIVTGFSANHIPVALLMLRSLGKAGMEAREAGLYNISIVAYTLEVFNSTMRGIVECVIRELNENYKIPTELRDFEFSAHPPWMTVNQSRHYDGVGKYAWKGIIIHTVLVERGFILWVDAGCRYTRQALTESLDNTKKAGLAIRTSAGFVPQYVNHGTIEYYRYKVRYGAAKYKNCDTSGVGLTLDTYDTLGRPFYDCSLTRQCLGPDGATRDDHRFDQSIFTIIADIANSTCTGLSTHVKRHMDYHPFDYSATYPSKCYKDPLQMEVEWK